MSNEIASRRTFLHTAAFRTVAVAATATAAVTAASPALAYQGNMERALSSLYDALASLREASPTKGGHKAEAVQLIQQAIEQVREGIQYADQHGNG